MMLPTERMVNPRTFQDFLALGEEPLDPQLVENFGLGSMDSEFAVIANMLMNCEELSQDELDTLYHFVTTLRTRTPNWKLHEFAKVQAEARGMWDHFLAEIQQWIDESRGLWPGSIDTLLEARDQLVYLIGLHHRSNCERSVLMRKGASVHLLTRQKSGPQFVLSDNPVRPFHFAAPQRIGYAAVPGLKEKSACISLPLSPDICLNISLDRPHNRMTHRLATESEQRNINTAQAYMAIDELIFPSKEMDVFNHGFDLLRCSRPLRC